MPEINRLDLVRMAPPDALGGNFQCLVKFRRVHQHYAVSSPFPRGGGGRNYRGAPFLPRGFGGAEPPERPAGGGSGGEGARPPPRQAGPT